MFIILIEQNLKFYNNLIYRPPIGLIYVEKKK